jgi:hypothetical protein
MKHERHRILNCVRDTWRFRERLGLGIGSLAEGYDRADEERGGYVDETR